jgi:hypothetical protein
MILFIIYLLFLISVCGFYLYTDLLKCKIDYKIIISIVLVSLVFILKIKY